MTTGTARNAHCSIEKMCKSPVLLLLLLSAFVGSVNAQAKEDWSLKIWCAKGVGHFTPRDRVARPGIGDRCENMKVRIATATERDAEYECRKEFPYHVTRAVPGIQTTCDVETGLICKQDWIQIYGRCFKLTPTHKTHSDAVKHCATQNSEIAFLHRAESAHVYSRINTRIDKVWVEASEAKKGDVLYRKGDHLILALDGGDYRVQNMAIVLVDGTKDKAHVLCEYTPMMTWEESSYLVRKYSEIYWKGFTNEEGMFIRTANPMTLNEKDYRADEKYCQNAMRPFINPTGHRFSGAYPSKKFLAELQTVKDTKSVTYVRTPARFEAGGKFRRDKQRCNEEKPKDPKNGYFIELRKPDVSNRKTHINDIWKAKQPVLECDGGSWSTAIRTLPKKEDSGMETMSDARQAPIYCQIQFTNSRYDKCETGWEEFERPSGMRWCHYHNHDNLDEAQSLDFCKSKGAQLDGYENRDEYMLMKSMVQAKVDQFRWGTEEDSQCWRNRLGGKRRQECTTGKWAMTDSRGNINPPEFNRQGFDPRPESACSRRNVFQWVDNVASEPPSINDDNWNKDTNSDGSQFLNPSYRHKGRNEKCLEILSNGDMNDYDCGSKTCFFCGKEAPIVPDI